MTVASVVEIDALDDPSNVADVPVASPVREIVTPVSRAEAVEAFPVNGPENEVAVTTPLTSNAVAADDLSMETYPVEPSILTLRASDVAKITGFGASVAGRGQMNCMISARIDMFRRSVRRMKILLNLYSLYSHIRQRRPQNRQYQDYQSLCHQP